MSYLGLLDKVADVSRGTESKSATKETTRTFAVVAAAEACSIQRVSGTQRKAESGTFRSYQWDGYFRPDLDIRNGDRVAEAATGQTFEVVNVEPIRLKVLQVKMRELTVVPS